MKRQPRAADAVVTVRTPEEPRGPVKRALLVMAGAEATSHPLPERGEVAIGRGSKCAIAIDHPTLSRTHLVLRLGAKIEVIDQDSANGTTVRGAKLPANTPVELAAYETFQAGDVVLVVQELRASAMPAARVEARPSGPVDATHAIVIEPALERLYEVAARVARGAIGVLIVGETGAGKEVLAEHVHRSSPRVKGPLVRINCAALSESLIESELFGHARGAFTGAQGERTGLIEAAAGGTVMLDEVGELSLPVQAKLLRVLEDRCVMRVGATTATPVDVRFIAATNRDLEAAVAAGGFRRDLYFRIAGAVLAIPPLRARPKEIEPLARKFLAQAAAQQEMAAPELTPAALAALLAHGWPGNVRELKSTLERAVLVTDGAITPDDLALAAPTSAAPAAAVATPAPVSATKAAKLPEELAALERQRIVEALDQAGGNQTRAAEALGMPRRTLVKRLAQLGIQRPRADR